MGTRVREERSERQPEAKTTNARSGEIAERLQKLATAKATAPQKETQPLQGTWRPQRIILGGWNEGSMRETMVKQAEDFLNAHALCDVRPSRPTNVKADVGQTDHMTSA